MTTVRDQITSTNQAICTNIDLLAEQRGLLSQNILSQLRNLIEGVAVGLHHKSLDTQFNYDNITPALDFIKSQGKLNFLSKFHKLIQKVASHYTLDNDNSERLMIKYYEYLHKTRHIINASLGINTLTNLEKFPINLDPSLREYHDKIAERIYLKPVNDNIKLISGRYYIHKIVPFFCNGFVLYEVTFYRAINRANKSERIIAFTDLEISDNHAVMLKLQRDSIDVIDQTMPITIIRHWEVSIRPCEINNFSAIFGINSHVKPNSDEYKLLMNTLTSRGDSLLDIVTLPDNVYNTIKTIVTQNTPNPNIFNILDVSREIIKSSSAGHCVIRYLMFRMNNNIIKLQSHRERCYRLSNLKLKFGCIPFDDMPFCSSLPGHNPRYWDLVESLEASDRKHEFLARQVRNNVENNGILYTPESELSIFGDLDGLIKAHNRKVYFKHQERHMVLDKKHIFFRGYEDDTVSIIDFLQNKAANGIDGYTKYVEAWINEAPRGIDDPMKSDALKKLFEFSCVALIYGAAGTGKSTMLDHIARCFNSNEKLFLAHTNPAIDNLQRRITAQYSEFRTINSQISKSRINKEYDLLIIDECSTVSNSDFLQVLEKTSFKLIVLVGDIFQIESIQFGNWFGIIRHFINRNSIFELTTPYRTQSKELLYFWEEVRKNEDDIAEVIAKNGYSALLNNSLFEKQSDDEIILCLNYDGLYGINNVNRFLQSRNINTAHIWQESTYKVGDPILFSDTERFRPVIFNNLKGWIVGIAQDLGWIQFDVKLDRSLSAFDVLKVNELKWVSESTVRFKVYDFPNSIDDDDDSLNTTVPFQVAYAVSIHKAQGLEYNSVKIVITDSNEDHISHNIFYTAITRTRCNLKIFWTPETQQRILSKLSHKTNTKDVYLLNIRRGLTIIS